MCTAITYKTKDHYFGRNLDLEYSYQETVTITPRNYSFEFRKAGSLKSHYAMIGMAYVQDGYPLYYDAVNEKGLSMAGLMFAGNAVYGDCQEGKENVSPFEFIPWILGQCANIREARARLAKICLVKIPYSESLPLTPLHWIIADRNESIVVEAMATGMKVYDNPTGVLTNNPPFEFQMMNLNNYMALSCKDPQNSFAEELEMTRYSRGMGALGLPGDLSSQSRFVRAAFHKMNAVAGKTETESVNQFFHLLGSVEMPRGSLEMRPDVYEITVYSSCCNMDKGIYYYTTYENSQIIGVDMYAEDLNGKEVISYDLVKEKEFTVINR